LSAAPVSTTFQSEIEIEPLWRRRPQVKKISGIERTEAMSNAQCHDAGLHRTQPAVALSTLADHAVDGLAAAARQPAQTLSTLAYQAVDGVATAVQQAARALTADLRQIRGALDKRRRRNRTIHELQRLDDRMLRDIGLYRGDIRAVADGLVQRPPRHD
jgi:uncharacterized protein YjiS (DUF1127 family)